MELNNCMIACTGEDDTACLRVIDFETGEERTESYTTLGECAMSPDGTQFAICPEVGVHILGNDLQLIKSIVVSRIYCLRYLVHSPHLVLGTAHGEILLYNLVDDKVSARTTEAEGHDSGISAFYESHCGRFLCSGSYDTHARCWSLPDLMPLGEGFEHNQTVYAVLMLSDSTTVITGCDDAGIRVWNRETGSNTKALQAHTESVYCLALDPQEATFLSGGSDQKLHQWDATSFELLRSFTFPGAVIMASYCLKEACVVIGCSRVGVFVRHLESDTDLYTKPFGDQFFSGLCCASAKGRPKAINAEIQFVDVPLETV